MGQNFRVDFFSKKIKRDFSYKIHHFSENQKKFKGISFVKLKIIFYRDFSCKIEGEFNFLGMIFERNYKRFPRKKWRKFFNGDFHVKLEVNLKFFTRYFHVNLNVFNFSWIIFFHSTRGISFKMCFLPLKFLKGFTFKFTPC